MENYLIRRAGASEQRKLEDLQMRASLTNAGDRDALLAHPDVIELPPEQIAAGSVFVAERNGAIAGFAALLPRSDGGAELVGRPGDSLSGDSFFHVGVSPADGASVFGMSTNVFHELAAEVRNRGEHSASDYVALDLSKPDFDLIQPG